jgi:hypothetical protein
MPDLLSDILRKQRYEAAQRRQREKDAILAKRAAQMAGTTALKQARKGSHNQPQALLTANEQRAIEARTRILRELQRYREEHRHDPDVNTLMKLSGAGRSTVLKALEYLKVE